MAKHTTFKTGGTAAFLVTPENKEQICELTKKLKDIPHIVIGNGSNLLFADGEYDGVVIEISSNFKDIQVDGDKIIAQSGALLSKIANIALKNSLAGFEFASGIPGTIGGAVYMNAGAYGGEMKDVITEVACIDRDGNIKIIKDFDFSYRHSVFESADLIVLEVTIALQKGDASKIKDDMKGLNERRREKQPLEYPSAGSTFKRPTGYFAGKLIEDAGLKGYRIGGAMVSEKHAGFVINYDNATASDIIKLMEHIKNTVHEKFGVELEPEVKIIKNT